MAPRRRPGDTSAAVSASLGMRAKRKEEGKELKEGKPSTIRSYIATEWTRPGEKADTFEVGPRLTWDASMCRTPFRTKEVTPALAFCSLGPVPVSDAGAHPASPASPLHIRRSSAASLSPSRPGLRG